MGTFSLLVVTEMVSVINGVNIDPFQLAVSVQSKPHSSQLPLVELIHCTLIFTLRKDHCVSVTNVKRISLLHQPMISFEPIAHANLKCGTDHQAKGLELCCTKPFRLYTAEGTYQDAAVMPNQLTTRRDMRARPTFRSSMLIYSLN